MKEDIRVKIESNVALLTLNRPDKHNAFDLELISDLSSQLIFLSAEKSVQGLIITGAGKAFCTGGDLHWAHEHDSGPAAAFHILSGHFHQAITEIRNMRKPVIAAVNGMAAGGGFSLALSCDFRVMAKSAILFQGFTSNGLSMDGGCSHTLPRLVGYARALEIAAYDTPITSSQALEWGLATKIANDENLLDEAELTIQEILKGSLNSFGWSKQLLNESFNTPMEQQMERERTGLSGCAAHPDGIEGVKAFIQKRPPRFNRDED